MANYIEQIPGHTMVRILGHLKADTFDDKSVQEGATKPTVLYPDVE
jgi:hypothetical protein